MVDSHYYYCHYQSTTNTVLSTNTAMPLPPYCTTVFTMYHYSTTVVEYHNRAATIRLVIPPAFWASVV
eukprot:4571524-Pyramimonas_sp.AAC.1